MQLYIIKMKEHPFSGFIIVLTVYTIAYVMFAYIYYLKGTVYMAHAIIYFMTCMWRSHQTFSLRGCSPFNVRLMHI